MRFGTRGLAIVGLLAIFASTGCSNVLNPLCGSARPAPQIGSISPSTVTLAEAQSGATITVKGSNFVSSSQVVVNTTPLAPTVVSSTQLTVKLTGGLITATGPVSIKVHTPSGNSGDLGCSSGGDSSALTLTVD